MADEVATGGRESRVLDAAMLAFDLQGEAERLRGEDAWRQERRNAITLVKGPRLRVVLATMQAGTRMHAPHPDGPLSLLPLSGRIALQAAGKREEASPGHLLTLEDALPYDVEALEEAAFLLCIAFEGHNAGQPGHGRS